ELLGQLDQPPLHRGELLAHAPDVGPRRQVGQVPEALGDALDGGGGARLAAIEVGHEVEVGVAVDRRLDVHANYTLHSEHQLEQQRKAVRHSAVDDQHNSITV